jgi:hypothetical protein
MIKRIFACLLPAVAAVSLLAPAAAMASVSAPAAPAHSAVVADTPDGYPDPVTIEPDITARPMCLSSAPNWCAHFTTGGYIYDGAAGGGPGPDWNVKFNRNGNTFTWLGHTYNVGTLAMPGHSPACFGLSISVVRLANCSTGYGTIWGHGSSNGHDVWINRAATQADNSLRVLVSTAGCQCGFGPLSEGDWFDSALYRKWNF